MLLKRVIMDINAVRQAENLKLLKVMQAEAQNRGFLSGEEIQAEINDVRSKNSS